LEENHVNIQASKYNYAILKKMISKKAFTSHRNIKGKRNGVVISNDKVSS